MAKKLRHAILGTGRISGKHFDGYKAISDIVEITSICDIDEKKLKAAQDKYDIKNIFTDYKSLFSSGEIDSVSVCLGNSLHAPVSIEALRSGIHVHCEKPMAMNTSEASEMLKASLENRKILMIGLNNRFTPYAQYVKRLINTGWLGDIYYAKCGWMRRSGIPVNPIARIKEYSGGGALIDLGVHFIDLAMFFMDYPEVESVAAKTYSKIGGSPLSPIYTYRNQIVDPDLPFDVEDLVAGMIFLKNNASIQFEISFASNIEKECNYYDIYGDKGGVSYRFYPDYNDKPELKLFSVLEGQHVDIIPHINVNAFPISEFKHFADSVCNENSPYLAPPEQGVSMMKIIDAIYKSDKTHSQIKIQ